MSKTSKNASREAQAGAAPAPSQAEPAFDMMAAMRFGELVKLALDAWVGSDCPVARVVAISLAPEGSGFDAGAIIVGGALDDAPKHMAEIASRSPTPPVLMECLAPGGELALMMRFPFPQGGLPPYLPALDA